MAELIVIGFHGMQRASEVLNELIELREDWTIELQDAVAVYRTAAGRLRLDQSYVPTRREEAASAGLMGAFFGGILVVPIIAAAGVAAAATAASLGVGVLAGGTIGAVLGAEDAAGWKREWGISDDFVRDVGGMVQPGQSALFVLARAAEPEVVAERFRGYGGTIIRTTLSPEAAAKLQATLANQSG